MSETATEYLVDVQARVTRLNLKVSKVQQAFLEHKKITDMLATWQVRYGAVLDDFLSVQKDLTYIQQVAENLSRVASQGAAFGEMSSAMKESGLNGEAISHAEMHRRGIPHGASAVAAKASRAPTPTGAPGSLAGPQQQHSHQADPKIAALEGLKTAASQAGQILRSAAVAAGHTVGGKTAPERRVQPTPAPVTVLRPVVTEAPPVEERRFDPEIIPLMGANSIWQRRFSPSVTLGRGRGFAEPGYATLGEYANDDLRRCSVQELIDWPDGFYRNDSTAGRQLLLHTPKAIFVVDNIENPDEVPVLIAIDPQGNPSPLLSAADIEDGDTIRMLVSSATAAFDVLEQIDRNK